MKKIKWIFFDIGGVIRDETNYNIWRKQALISYAKKINPKITEEDFDKTHVKASGMTGSLRQNILEILIGNKEIAKQIKNEIHNKGTTILQNCPVMQNALEVIKKISQKYSLGVISNYSSAIKDFLKEAELIDYFKVLGISEDYNLHKPDPEFFKTILKEVNAKFEESAMIDDNIERSLDVAKQLGMTTVFYNTNNRKDIPKDIVDFTIYSLTDLLRIF